MKKFYFGIFIIFTGLAILTTTISAEQKSLRNDKALQENSRLKVLKQKHRGKTKDQLTNADVFEWARLKMEIELNL